MEQNDCIIIISHSNYRIKGAGVEKYILEISDLLTSNGIQNVQLFPVIEVNKKTKVFGKEYFGVNVNGAYKGIYDENNLYGLLGLLQEQYDLNYLGVHLNHLHGWNLDSLEQALKKLSLPIKIIVHDYEMICASMLKPDGNGPDCRKMVSKPDADKCRGCKYAEYNISRFIRINNFLNDINYLVESVVAPSEIAGNNWIETYTNYKNKMVIREHLSVSSLEKNEKNCSGKIKIAYIGSTASHKGFAEWMELAKHLQRDRYELYYFGKEKPEQDGVKKVYVNFQDKNSEGMTEQLKCYSIDIVFLWSTWHETYCYTAYEACSAGCYLLSVSYSGNISAMIKKFRAGRIFDSLEDCIKFLNNPDAVKAEIEEFETNRNVPLFNPNTSSDELLFSQKPDSANVQANNFLNAELNVKRARLLTFIYYIARGNYKK